MGSLTSMEAAIDLAQIRGFQQLLHTLHRQLPAGHSPPNSMLLLPHGTQLPALAASSLPRSGLAAVWLLSAEFCAMV